MRSVDCRGISRNNKKNGQRVFKFTFSCLTLEVIL
jgi:hypothetical protein